jgi:hypothetical protein
MHPHIEDGTMTPRPKLELGARLPRYAVEMVVGLLLAVLIVLALVATVGSVPFIYQGF